MILTNNNNIKISLSFSLTIYIYWNNHSYAVLSIRAFNYAREDKSQVEPLVFV